MQLAPVLLTVALISSVQAAAPLQTEQLNKNCLKSSGATPDQIAKIRTGKFTDEGEVHKYFGCMLRAAGVINSTGQLQVNVLSGKVPTDMKKEDAMKIFLSCKDKKGANVDETAYALYKCFWEASPRHLSLDGM